MAWWSTISTTRFVCSFPLFSFLFLFLFLLLFFLSRVVPNNSFHSFSNDDTEWRNPFECASDPVCCSDIWQRRLNDFHLSCFWDLVNEVWFSLSLPLFFVVQFVLVCESLSHFFNCNSATSLFTLARWEPSTQGPLCSLWTWMMEFTCMWVESLLSISGATSWVSLPFSSSFFLLFVGNLFSSIFESFLL